jgi:hypothetical protein
VPHSRSAQLLEKSLTPFRSLTEIPQILCFVDRTSLYNLVNKTNLMHNLFLVCLSISTYFRRLWAHHQEKQLCFCPSSEEITVFLQHLVFVILKQVDSLKLQERI